MSYALKGMIIPAFQKYDYIPKMNKTCFAFYTFNFF
jgi:hypothetical protein